MIEEPSSPQDRPAAMPSAGTEAGLCRQMGLAGLVATGVCSMVGAAINIIPIMLERNVPGIGPYVLEAYLLALPPVVLAALAYAGLASAMPRAGGSYVFASRAIHPYVGFIASFSQWFGLSVAIGVVAYVLIPFLRDLAQALGLMAAARSLEGGLLRVVLALGVVWLFAAVNILGIRVYERTLVPLMLAMFAGLLVAIPAGFAFNHTDFLKALLERDGVRAALPPPMALDWNALVAASAVLFSSFIGFDSIAQAGGEARNPRRNLPLAIGISVLTVGSFYLLFTAAIYHAVPWNWIARASQGTDLTAPGLLAYLLSPGWTLLITAGATVGLINNFPAMILAVSRLMFAWSEDGVFPAWLARVDSRRHTPQRAIAASALMASAAILGCHLAGDFFLGVDVLVTAMLVNFLIMCLSLLALPRTNPQLAARVAVGRSPWARGVIGAGGVLLLGIYLVIHTLKDLTAPATAWYFRSTWLWFLLSGVGTLLFLFQWRRLCRDEPGFKDRFRVLPPQ